MIAVIAESEAKLKYLEKIIGLSKELVLASLNEPGCIEYRLFQSTSNPCLLTMVEKWEDETALENHKKSVHVREIVPVLNEMRETKPVVKILKEL